MKAVSSYCVFMSEDPGFLWLDCLCKWFKAYSTALWAVISILVILIARIRKDSLDLRCIGFN